MTSSSPFSLLLPPPPAHSIAARLVRSRPSALESHSQLSPCSASCEKERGKETSNRNEECNIHKHTEQQN
ncbi:hypothetical protein AKJ16_DCAP11734, partial [Drosera capensis]